MARIVNYQASTDVPTQRTPQLSGAGAEPVFLDVQAAGSLGRQIAGIGRQLGQFEEKLYQTRVAKQQADASIFALQETNNFLSSLDRDTDYGTQLQRFDQKMSEIKTKATDGLEPEAARNFNLNFEERSLALRLKMSSRIAEAEQSKARGSLITSVYDLGNSVANAGSKLEFETAKDQAIANIQQLERGGGLLPEQAAKMKIEVNEGFSRTFINSQIASDPYAALDGLKSGAFDDVIPSSIKPAIIEDAERAVQKQIQLEAAGERARAATQVTALDKLADDLVNGYVPEISGQNFDTIQQLGEAEKSMGIYLGDVEPGEKPAQIMADKRLRLALQSRDPAVQERAKFLSEVMSLRVQYQGEPQSVLRDKLATIDEQQNPIKANAIRQELQMRQQLLTQKPADFLSRQNQLYAQAAEAVLSDNPEVAQQAADTIASQAHYLLTGEEASSNAGVLSVYPVLTTQAAKQLAEVIENDKIPLDMRMGQIMRLDNLGKYAPQAYTQIKRELKDSTQVVALDLIGAGNLRGAQQIMSLAGVKEKDLNFGGAEKSAIETSIAAELQDFIRTLTPGGQILHNKETLTASQAYIDASLRLAAAGIASGKTASTAASEAARIITDSYYLETRQGRLDIGNVRIPKRFATSETEASEILFEATERMAKEKIKIPLPSITGSSEPRISDFYEGLAKRGGYVFVTDPSDTGLYVFTKSGTTMIEDKNGKPLFFSFADLKANFAKRKRGNYLPGR